MTGLDDPSFAWELRCEWFVFDRLREERSNISKLPVDEQDLARTRWISLAFIAAEHSIYVNKILNGEITFGSDFDGTRSSGHCTTCEVSNSGVPCATIRFLAGLWSHHEDYRKGWEQESRNLDMYSTKRRWAIVDAGGRWNLLRQELEQRRLEVKP